MSVSTRVIRGAVLATLGCVQMIGGGEIEPRRLSRRVSGILMPARLEWGNYKAQSREMHLNCCLSGRLHQNEGATVGPRTIVRKRIDG